MINYAIADKLKYEVMFRYINDIDKAMEYVVDGLEVTEENIEYVTHVVVNNMLVGYGTIKGVSDNKKARTYLKKNNK